MLSDFRCAEGGGDAKAPSWSESDLLVLITEYWKRKEILRAKASESVTNLQKRECWLEITEAVNARCFPDAAGAKSMEQLKRKWERTIMLAKKAALNIQKKHGNLSDLAPAYQLALSIVCDDFPMSIDCTSSSLVAADVPSLTEPPTAHDSFGGEVSSMVVTELAEDSSLGSPILVQLREEAGKCIKTEAPIEEISGLQWQPLQNDSLDHGSNLPAEGEEQTSGRKRKYSDIASPEAAASTRKQMKLDSDLLELQKERLWSQMQYDKLQHDLEMEVLRAQKHFWEMKIRVLIPNKENCDGETT